MIPRLSMVAISALILSISVHAGSLLPPDVTLETILDAGNQDGEVSDPLAARHAGDGSGRLFIVEQAGTIKILDNTDDLMDDPFIDLSGRISAGGERGLLGLDFHPDYENNGLFYVNYTAGGSSPFITGTTVVSEFQVSGDPNIGNPASERVLLTIRQDDTNHNGGDIHFGPDGFLYIGMGDGGGGGGPCNRAQTLDPNMIVVNANCLDDVTVALLGKMLRIDVDNTTPPGSNGLCGAAGDGSAPYAIPIDNPFAGADPENGCDEVWSYGLRNPFRFSFDRITGDMFIGDVGQGTWEEVSFEPFNTSGGINYGWNVCEGEFLQGSTVNPCLLGELPILTYRRANGDCAVEGGYRYRGPVTSLGGLYIYGDFCSGNIRFGQETSPGNWTNDTVLNIGFGLTAFGEDEQGRIYVTSQNDGLLRFEGDEILILEDGFEEPVTRSRTGL